MKKNLLWLLPLFLLQTAQAQYSTPTVSVDKTKFCDQNATIHITAQTRANGGFQSGYHFNQMIFHFYWQNGGAPTLAGNFTVSKLSGPVTTSYTTSAHFDGSQITGAQVNIDTYNPSSPLGGGTFMVSIVLPWYALLNSNGTQFYVSAEAVDNLNNTTVPSSMQIFDNPVLYGNTPLSKPSISSTASSLCGGNTATISTSPDLSGQYSYLWYKDGSVLSGETSSTLNTGSPGSYYAYIYDACQNISSDAIVITSGSLPPAPNISSSNGTLLCNGASTTLSTSPSAGGTIYWSDGETGNSIVVSGAGSYYAYEVNACGSGSAGNTMTISTGSAPAAPSITPSGPVQLCNGNSVALSIPGGGNANWFRDGGLIAANSGTLNTTTPGSYTATLNNACGISGQSSAVVVTTAATPAAPVITSSNGTLLCNGASTVLSAASAGGTVNWSNGQTGTSITVSSAGSFSATETNACGTSGNSNTITITTNVTPPAPTLNVSGSILLCDGAGQTVFTSPSTPGGSIHWSYGLSGNSVTWYDPGSYYAYETNGCGNGPSSGFSIATSSRPPAPVVTPAGNTLLCNGASVSFHSSGSSIVWSNGVTGTTLNTNVAGAYYSYDHNACGNSANSNTVNVTTVVCPTPSPGSSFFVCPGFQKTLDAGAEYDSYSWSNGATTQTITVGPGTYSVTVSKNGCFATSQPVTVNYYTVTTPTINASGPTVFCLGSAVTLSSSAGIAYSWSNGSTASSIVVNTSGSYSVSVTDANGCVATSAPTSVTVNALPNASIAGSVTVCQNAATPMITFTGSGGVPPYTFTYNVNGGPSISITTSGSNMASIAVPTDVAGSFVYSLIKVKESSSTACDNGAAGVATVVVKALPTATIAGTTTVCKNSVAAQIIFIGSGGTAPYVFSYSINNGVPQTITTVSGNSVAVSVPTNITGTFVYSLISVQESSGQSCSNAVSGSATVTVKDLPTA